MKVLLALAISLAALAAGCNRNHAPTPTPKTDAAGPKSPDAASTTRNKWMFY